MIRYQASLQALRLLRQQFQKEHPHPSLQAKRQIKHRIKRKEKLTYLLRLRVGNSSFINPVVRFAVFGVINFLGWVDWRFEILEKAAFLFTLSVDKHLKRIIGANGWSDVITTTEQENITDLTMRV